MLRRTWGLPVDYGLELQTDIITTTDTLFGSFALLNSGQTATDDGTLRAFLEVDVALFNHEDEVAGELISYGFSKVVLQLVLRSNTKIVKRLAQPAEDLGGATLYARGTSLEPRWELIVPAGLLDGLYFTKAPLFEVDEAEEGAGFEAHLIASVNDGSLRRSDGVRPFGIEKQRLLEILMARGFGINHKGIIALGLQQLTIVKRGQDERQ